MARVTEASLDEPELRRLHASRTRAGGGQAIGAPVASVGRSIAPVISLALLIGGAGALLAPDPLPFAVELLGIGAIAVGGWLAGRDPRGPRPDVLAERLLVATFAERRDVIRAAVAVSALRGSDDAARRAGRAVAGQAGGEPEPAGVDDGEAGRPVLRAVAAAGTDAGESLDPGADAAELAGAIR